jgi:biotin operon repressor
MSRRIADTLLWYLLGNHELKLTSTKQVGVTTQRLVLQTLAAHADQAGVSWPSQQRIADICQLSRKSVQDSLAALEEAGHIKRVASKKKGQLVRWRVLPLVLPGLLAPVESGEHDGQHDGQHDGRLDGLARHEGEVEVEEPPRRFSERSETPRSKSPRGEESKEAKSEE